MGTLLAASERDAVEHDRAAFSLAVWDKIVADPELARLPYRIETDQHGQIIMSPPPAPAHGSRQVRIARLLGDLIGSGSGSGRRGEVVSECPILTGRGVKAADVAWCSEALWAEAETASCFSTCPEICVEVLSPSNSASEIEEKKQLYFEAGAREVWLCAENGSMSFFLSASSPQVSSVSSNLCPEFPRLISRKA